jgi:hypothetical protein
LNSFYHISSHIPLSCSFPALHIYFCELKRTLQPEFNTVLCGCHSGICSM